MLDNLFNNDLLRSSLYFGYNLNLYLDRGLLYVFGLVGLYRGLNLLSYITILTSCIKSGYSLLILFNLCCSLALKAICNTPH